ncbi:MAG: biotin--[acetyl-CoA-carboxylase] ligase [Anaerolineae bacterium]|jgi:BirA family biotin operon repressor/biotin-[acetyl-CoA-carboxylase] ligase|nr:MAG: biotin--[acetyl-CoA-carboxylase] ligase [Anaerolineae bacterium]
MVSNGDSEQLQQALAGLPLGGMRYFERLGSTMDEAAAWLEQGAPDLALVVAEQQSAGRGRLGRSWFTAPKASLAFSLILRQQASAPPTLWTGLGALAVCEAFEKLYSLQPQIKWPNDVLLNQRKVCGILTEAHWQGEQLLGIVLGIGINLAPSAVPPRQATLFPATCLQEHLPPSAQGLVEVNRFHLLAVILERLLAWRSNLHSKTFIQSWEARLAYRQQTIQIFKALDEQESLLAEGDVEGLNAEGNLIIRLTNGDTQTIAFGEIRLRPLSSNGGL